MDQPDKKEESCNLEQPDDKGQPERIYQAGHLAFRQSNNQRRECSDWSAVTASNTSSGTVTVSNVQALQLQGGVDLVAGDGEGTSTRKLVDQSGDLNSAENGNDIRYCSNWSGVVCRNKTTGDVLVNNSQGRQIQGGVVIGRAKRESQQPQAEEQQVKEDERKPSNMPKEGVSGQSAPQSYAGSRNSRKCCSDWSAVSCKNDTSGNLVVINLQGLQLQGGIEMNSADRSRLRALKRRQAAAQQAAAVPPTAQPAPAAGPSTTLENQRPGKRAHEPERQVRQVKPVRTHIGIDIDELQEQGELLKDGEFDLISDKFPSLEEQIVEARTRCSQELTFVSTVERRMGFWKQKMAQLQEKLGVAQEETGIYKSEAAYLQHVVGDLQLANGRLENSYKQIQNELEETRSRIPLQIKEAQIQAVASFKQSQELRDLVDSRCLKGYEGALNDVRARMAVLFPGMDTGFLDSVLDGNEPETSASAAGNRPSEIV